MSGNSASGPGPRPILMDGLCRCQDAKVKWLVFIQLAGEKESAVLCTFKVAKRTSKSEDSRRVPGGQLFQSCSRRSHCCRTTFRRLRMAARFSRHLFFRNGLCPVSLSEKSSAIRKIVRLALPRSYRVPLYLVAHLVGICGMILKPRSTSHGGTSRKGLPFHFTDSRVLGMHPELAYARAYW